MLARDPRCVWVWHPCIRGLFTPLQRAGILLGYLWPFRIQIDEQELNMFFIFSTCRLRGRSCLTIPVGRRLCNSTWSCISCWCCGCITTCLKARRCVSIFFWPFFFLDCQLLKLWNSGGGRWWLNHSTAAGIPHINCDKVVRGILILGGDSVQHYFTHPRPTFPQIYVQFGVAARLSSTYPAGKRAAGLRILSGWQIGIPSSSTFVYYFPLRQPEEHPQPCNPLHLPPPENCFPLELSLDAALVRQERLVTPSFC